MKIVFTRLTADRHRFDVLRDGRAPESRELETRSYLAHDLVHFTVERVFGFTAGFYGRLASGVALDQVDAAATDESWRVEGIVGRFQSYLHSRAPLPDGLDAEKVAQVERDWRALLGAWKATPYGGRLELDWGLTGTAARAARVSEPALKAR
ncbi:MAG: hypothetical protein JNK82_07215 [Myxococcaceae bacterium]|nr:hypothetical protein [Myxococcaceae bacterium]